MRYAKRIIAALLLILSLAIAFPGKVSQYGIHQAISPTLDDIDSHYMPWYQDRISLTLVSFDCAGSNLTPSFQEHEFGIGSYAVDMFGISHPNLKCNTYVVKVNKRLTLKR